MPLKAGQPARPEDRPVMTYARLLAEEQPTQPLEALLDSREFLSAVEALCGHAVDRRTVQFYSSPQLRLLPLPLYKSRHTSHYLHPEHTHRLAVILHLRRRYYFPPRLLRQILETLSPAHYGFILRDQLSAQDILLLSRSSETAPQDLIYRRIVRLLGAAHSPARAAMRELVDGPNLEQAVARFGAWLRNNLGQPGGKSGKNGGANPHLHRRFAKRGGNKT
jgi:hypothetical protein